jgi:aspartate/tyrosine/aromatic aminotransferase
MNYEFGVSVQKEAERLLASGKDVNQVAAFLCDKDPQGCNYGVGIVLLGDGKPMPTSPTLLEYVIAEAQSSRAGRYMNSAKLMPAVKESVLRWQRIPEKYWDQFHLALPSDAGTGAVQMAVQTALALGPQLTELHVEELGWPAYKAIAASSRLGFREAPKDSTVADEKALPIYQAGPMNTTGQVGDMELVKARAAFTGERKRMVVLDRAYSGFEFARLVEQESYDQIMKMSYEGQVAPFLEAAAPALIALSPTKAFASFALRPCGMLLAFCPDAALGDKIAATLNSVMRARGSSFEHPVTRAFAKAMASDRLRLESDHEAVLRRLAEAERLWREHARGTRIEHLFSDSYAGLFRNTSTAEGAEVRVYERHLYPVFGRGRCRLNVTGIPADSRRAAEQVAVFAENCV